MTELGIQQAKRIGECLSKKKDRYVINSSDLLRARRTTEIIAEFLEIEPIYTDVLRKFDLGEAVGKSKEWAQNVDDKPFIGAESK